MALTATSTHTVSNLVKREFEIELAYCRDVVTYNGAAKSFVVGDLVADDGTVPATAGDIYGVVIQEATAALNTDTALLVIKRGPASVSADALVLGLLDAADVAAQLESVGIQVLETV
jgi:hypothetical protein